MNDNEFYRSEGAYSAAGWQWHPTERKEKRTVDSDRLRIIQHVLAELEETFGTRDLPFVSDLYVVGPTEHIVNKIRKAANEKQREV